MICSSSWGCGFSGSQNFLVMETDEGLRRVLPFWRQFNKTAGFLGSAPVWLSFATLWAGQLDCSHTVLWSLLDFQLAGEDGRVESGEGFAGDSQRRTQRWVLHASIGRGCGQSLLRGILSHHFNQVRGWEFNSLVDRISQAMLHTCMTIWSRRMELGIGESTETWRVEGAASNLLVTGLEDGTVSLHDVELLVELVSYGDRRRTMAHASISASVG